MESTIDPIDTKIDESAITLPQKDSKEVICSKYQNRFVKKNSSDKILSPDSPLRYLDTTDLPRYAQPTVSFQLRVSLSHCSEENSPTNLPTCSRYRIDVPPPMLTSMNERRSRSVEPTVCSRIGHQNHHHRTPRVTKRCTSSAALAPATSLTSPIDQRGVLRSAPNVNRTKFIKSRLNASQTSDDHMELKDEGRASSVSIDKMLRQPRNTTPNPKKSSSDDNFRKRAASAERFLEKRLVKHGSKISKPPVPPNSMSKSVIAQASLSDKHKTSKKEAKNESFKDKLIGQAKDVISKIATSDSKPIEPKKHENKVKPIAKAMEVKERDNLHDPKRQDTKPKETKFKQHSEIKTIDVKVKSVDGKTTDVKLKSSEAKLTDTNTSEVRSNEAKPKPNEIKSTDVKPKSIESKSSETKPKSNETKSSDQKPKTNEGKDENVEDYKAKLAEKRRLAREKQEKDAEEERLNQIRIKEEEAERLRLEEEAEEKRMLEEIKLVDAARVAEQERLQKLTIEEEERKKIEAEKIEAEAQMKREQEKIKKEEAERAEEARRIRINKEEQEKIERKKRLENIMKRVKPEDKKPDEALGLDESQAITIMQDMVSQALVSDATMQEDSQLKLVLNENSSNEVQKLVVKNHSDNLDENEFENEQGKPIIKESEAALKTDDKFDSKANETNDHPIIDEVSNLISTDSEEHLVDKNETIDQKVLKSETIFDKNSTSEKLINDLSNNLNIDDISNNLDNDLMTDPNANPKSVSEDLIINGNVPINNHIGVES